MQLETKKLSKYGISTKQEDEDKFVSKSYSAAQHRGKVQSANRSGIENANSEDKNDEKSSLINELKLNR